MMAMKNLIRDDLTLVGPDTSETFLASETPKPLVEQFLNEIKRYLGENEAFQDKAWLVNFTTGEVIKYGEILAKINR
jgi:hypothetical protein